MISRLGIRTRLLLAVAASVAVALALMTVGFNVALHRTLARDVRNLARARVAAGLTTVDVEHGRLVVAESLDDAALDSQVWVFAGTKAIEHPRVHAALDGVARRLAGTSGVFADVPAAHARLLSAAIRHQGRQVGTVVVGVALTPYQRTERVALYGSLAMALAVLLVVVVGARWALAAALRPVARMTADAEAWSEAEPDRRFAAGEPYDELSQLAATLDGLLGRLAASLRREQRFSAELSHELRTPLARVCAEADLALRRERTSQEYRDALTLVLRNAQQMSRAVDTLVAAAQQEAGQGRGRSEASEVLEEAAEICAMLATERTIELAVGVPPLPLVLGVDADTALRIVQPVVENACRLAAHVVRLDGARRGASIVLSITDDGPGVLPEEREAIFEPGFRGAAAAGDGAGLGLALARRLARAVGGELTLASGDEAGRAGARFAVSLPSG
jgi:two-component system OmpR family sensor kinase